MLWIENVDLKRRMKYPVKQDNLPQEHMFQEVKENKESKAQQHFRNVINFMYRGFF